MGRMVHDGIGALPDGIGLCPLAIVPARAGQGGIGSPPVRGQRLNFTKALRAAGRPPVASGVCSASLDTMGGGVHDGKGALPARNRAREGWVRLGHGGTGSPPLRGHRQNFTKALRATGRPPVASGGCLGLSGHHGRQVARWNKGIALQNFTPARVGSGGTGSRPVRRHRQNFTKALRAAGRPPVASGGWLGLSGRHGQRGA